MAFVSGVGGLLQPRGAQNALCARRHGVRDGENALHGKQGERADVVMMAKGKNSKYRQRPMRQNPVGAEIPEDGTPVFSVVVRSQTGARMWYPCGGVQGDKRAKTLVDGMKTRWGRGLYSGALDRGIAQTIFRNRSKWEQNASKQFPALKGSKLEFGYRIAAAGMETTQTRIITEEQSLPFIQWLQYKISSMVENAKAEAGDEE